MVVKYSINPKIPVYDITNENRNAAKRAMFKNRLALCVPISDFLLIKIMIPPITTGKINTLATCVAICAIIGFTPKIGTISPIKHAIAAKYLKVEDLISIFPCL